MYSEDPQTMLPSYLLDMLSTSGTPLLLSLYVFEFVFDDDGAMGHCSLPIVKDHHNCHHHLGFALPLLGKINW